MRVSAEGARFTAHHEGFVPRYYLDPVGIGTIGIGFTWRSAAFRRWWEKNRPGKKFGPGATITRAEAEEALRLLMDEEYGAAVMKKLGSGLKQEQMDGSSSVVFNCGAATLDDRWGRAAKSGDWEGAAALLKTTRVTARGRRLPGLVSRRLDESELILLGDYTIGRPRATRQAADPMEDGVLVRGERGDAVTRLQADLQVVGYYQDQRVDDVFGRGTEAAVMEFQRAVGLKDDGFAGPKTLSALAEAVRLRSSGGGDVKNVEADAAAGAAEPQESAVEPAEASQSASAAPAEPQAESPTRTDPEPAQPPTPAGTSTSKAKGGALGAFVVGQLLALAVHQGWLPQAIAEDPTTQAFLYGVALSAGAYVGSWFAPPNGSGRGGLLGRLLGRGRASS